MENQCEGRGKYSKKYRCESTKILGIEFIKEGAKKDSRPKGAQAIFYKACLLFKTSMLSIL